MITIRYPDGPNKKNYVAKDPDEPGLNIGGHYYTDDRSKAINFLSESHAFKYIADHKWMADMHAKDLFRVETT